MKDEVISKDSNYLRFWGKQRAAIDGGADWHAAAYHCLDVAASAHTLLESNELLRRQLAKLLAIPERQLVDLMTFWIVLHDVGKFSAPFNGQVEALWLPEMGERSTVPDTPRHGLVCPTPLRKARTGTASAKLRARSLGDLSGSVRRVVSGRKVMDITTRTG